jgi:hypothetical protein
MLQDGRPGHGQRPSELGDRGRRLAKPLHYDPPTRVRQRVEIPVQVRRLVKHALEYQPTRLNSQATASASHA